MQSSERGVTDGMQSEDTVGPNISELSAGDCLSKPLNENVVEGGFQCQR